MKVFSHSLLCIIPHFLQARGVVADDPFYAPALVACPSGPLLRKASGIAPAETAYTQHRNIKTAAALNSWLASLNDGFDNVSASSAPTLAASWSGGGYRALLNGAGSRQAMDIRDGNGPVAGLYQALTYESGLSGGAWFLGGVASDNYPTISSLTQNFYLPNIQSGLLAPGGLLGTVPNLLDIILAQVGSKQAAGYEVTIVDIYGRLLGYNLLSGSEGGIAKHFSDIFQASNFSAYDVPMPIITTIALNSSGNRCSDLMNAQQAQVEITPFEFGSWDNSIYSFTPTKYLGTRLNAGKSLSGQCATGFDSTGFIQGTSGNVLAAAVCGLDEVLPFDIGNDVLTLVRTLQQLLLQIRGTADPADIAGASYPNPFFQSSSTAPAYSSGSQLYLVDGAFTGQNNPIWPHLHRNVTALLATDDVSNISSLHTSYVQARAAGLTRMPVIPDVAVYDNATMPRFFGCHQPDTMTIVWLPGFNYVYPNNITGSELQLNAEQINGMIANGKASANGNGYESWGTCVACAVLAKSSSKLPDACAACFDKYCWN